MAFGLNGLGMKASLKERAAVLIHFVVRFGVTVEHELRQVPRWFFAVLPRKEVIMIWLEAIGNHGKVIGKAVFLDFCNGEKIILRFAEKGGFIHAAIVDVIVHSFLPGEQVFSSVGHVFLQCRRYR